MTCINICQRRTSGFGVEAICKTGLGLAKAAAASELGVWGMGKREWMREAGPQTPASGRRWPLGLNGGGFGRNLALKPPALAAKCQSHDTTLRGIRV